MAYLASNLNDGNELVFDRIEDKLTWGRDARGVETSKDNIREGGENAE